MACFLSESAVVKTISKKSYPTTSAVIFICITGWEVHILATRFATPNNIGLLIIWKERLAEEAISSLGHKCLRADTVVSK